MLRGKGHYGHRSRKTTGWYAVDARVDAVDASLAVYLGELFEAGRPGAAPRGTSVRRVGTDALPDAESATAEGSSGRYNRTVMSIQVAYRDGVFKPLEEVAGAEPGAIYTAFSKEELRELFIETVGWLKAAE